ncbi:MAG: type II toxin-antitoxin system HipA family toxin [Ilumatobacteraceae bacterium]
MSYQPVDVIEVFVWGHQVGAVARNPATGQYAFEYTPDWIRSGVELAPLHMPLARTVYEFPGLADATYHRLPPLLADALPDAFGNALVDRWMAEQGIEPAHITPLDRLAYAADRGMGALEFRPRPRGRCRASHGRAARRPRARRPPDRARRSRRRRPRPRRAGAVDPGGHQRRRGKGQGGGGVQPGHLAGALPYGPAPEGFEHWLIKLDGVGARGLDGRTDRLGDSAPYCRVEYAYSQMAAAAGVAMAECRLLAEGPRRHFMTRRFDRGPGGAKHHLLTLCGMAHLDFNMVGAHSYDQYLQTVRALGLAGDALQQAYRRMVFNVMAVNHDDHTKNVAFLRREGAGWELAPAYDITHAYRPGSVWTERHLMSVNGRFDGTSLADLYAVGERHGVPGYRRVVREVRAAVDDWPSFAADADVPAEATATIEADIAAFRPS